MVYFINEYLNKILHKRIKTSTQQMMNDLGKDKENYYKIFPGFDYNQWFESLNYFKTNIISNDQVQL